MRSVLSAIILSVAWLTGGAAFASSGPSVKELLEHPYHGYEIIIQIDKSSAGSSLNAQRLRIHRYHASTGEIEFVGRWHASTGAETPERDIKGRLSTRKTPTGFYKIDFLNQDAYSRAWDGPMLYAMYWDYNGGYAIHGTEEYNYFKLGQRASAGCTRLRLANARQLFTMIEGMGKGRTLKLNKRTGKPLYNAEGKPIVQRTYKALVLIEDEGELEVTRFGFRHRDEVYSGPNSHHAFMSPHGVAYSSLDSFGSEGASDGASGDYAAPASSDYPTVFGPGEIEGYVPSVPSGADEGSDD